MLKNKVKLRILKDIKGYNIPQKIQDYHAEDMLDIISLAFAVGLAIPSIAWTFLVFVL